MIENYRRCYSKIPNWGDVNPTKGCYFAGMAGLGFGETSWTLCRVGELFLLFIYNICNSWEQKSWIPLILKNSGGPVPRETRNFCTTQTTLKCGVLKSMYRSKCWKNRILFFWKIYWSVINHHLERLYLASSPAPLHPSIQLSRGTLHSLLNPQNIDFFHCFPAESTVYQNSLLFSPFDLFKMTAILPLY